VQVFLYFSGHGATGSGRDVLMYGNDGKQVSFYDLIHARVTSTGAPVIAVLDCRRVKEQLGAQKPAAIPAVSTAAVDVCISGLTLPFFSWFSVLEMTSIV
jgi:hypothetical protein